MTKKLKTKAQPIAPQLTDGASSTWMPFGAPINEIVLALGLGGLIFMRPWIDGLRYPERNTYFVWLTSGLFALWCTRLFFRKEGLRYPFHAILLSVFVLIAFATGFASVQYDATYRSLLNWVSYLMIFVMVASGLRSPAAITIILGFFVYTSFAETIWSIFHIKYVMPIQRDALQDPELLRLYFDTSEMTPEFRSRIESNRAMGSLLSANALAGWILVAIPFAIGGAAHAYLRLLESAPVQPASELRANTRALILGLLMGIGTFLPIAVFYALYFKIQYPGESWTDHSVRWTLYCVVIPSALGAFTFRAAHRSGMRRVLLRIQCVALTALAILQCVGLAHTYSRGGILATATALTLGGALVWYGGKRASLVRKGTIAILVLITAASVFHALNGSAWAQDDAPIQPSESSVDIQGVDPSLEAMMDPATALLRLSYWRSGLEMFLANPWIGVGLGNFGTVYPKYQLPNSADVKQAHNDFLQAFCETGFFGGLAFFWFWAWFAYSGARRILRESDTAHRSLLAGLYCGTLAFVFHGVVDFNFSNSALATLAFLFAGLFLSTAADKHVPAIDPKASLILGASGLIIAAVVVAFGWRVHLVDSTIGSKMERKLRLEAAVRLLELDTSSAANLSSAGFLQISDRAVSYLIPSRSARESFGKLYTRIQPGGSSARPIIANERIPDNAVLLVIDPWKAKARAMERIPLWLDMFVDADSRYPYDPEVSAHLCLWYELLFGQADSSQEKLRCADQSLAWAKECVRRSPEEVRFRNLLARCYWRRGEIDETEAQLEYYDAALDEYLKCVELFPSRPDVYFDYADLAASYGQLRKDAGDVEGGQALIEKAEAIRQRGQRLEDARAAAGR